MSHWCLLVGDTKTTRCFAGSGLEPCDVLYPMSEYLRRVFLRQFCFSDLLH